MPVSAEGRVEHQNEPKRPPLCGRLGSFWCSTRFTRKVNEEWRSGPCHPASYLPVFLLFSNRSTYEAGWHGPDHRTAFTFLVNRVEHQNEPKRPQSGGRLGSFWCSTRPSADTGTDYHGVDYNQCPCLPKAELTTKTNTNSHHCGPLGSFWCSTRFTRKVNEE